MRRSLKAGIASAAVSLFACASATPINTGDGRQAYLIECPGAANSMSNCIRKANAVCSAGYDIAGASESPQGMASAILDPNLGTVCAIQGVDRGLVVLCK